MKNEEKNLLLKDLCGRLPYGVNVDIKYSTENGSSLRAEVCSEGMLKLNTDVLGLLQEEEIYLKPYLRPMSSITEAEKTMFNSIWDSDWDKALTNQIAEAWDRNGFENQTKILEIAACANAINFLISHHFDYNGLIEKELAIEAPKDMYNIK